MVWVMVVVRVMVRVSSNQMHFAYTRNRETTARKIGRWFGQGELGSE